MHRAKWLALSCVAVFGVAASLLAAMAIQFAGHSDDLEHRTIVPAAARDSGDSPVSLGPRTRGAPAILNQLEVMFTDASTGQVAFDIDADPLFGSNPVPELIAMEEGIDWHEMVRANIHWMAELGYDGIDVPVVLGYGAVFVRSKVLAELRHGNFDYDAQYDDAGDLTVPEEEAFQRYHIAGDMFPFVVVEAHAAGLTVNANIEALAHIISRASGGGIGGEEADLMISGNLPSPSAPDVLTFIDETLAAWADSISAEAFSPEYDEAIERHLAALGVPYWHTGAGRGKAHRTGRTRRGWNPRWRGCWTRRCIQAR